MKSWAKVFGFPKDPRSYGEYVTRAAPDRRRILVFEPGMECSMMRYSFQFRLVDKERAVLQAFKGLSTPVQSAWWTPDSRIIAVPLYEGALLLYHAGKGRYSLIRFSAYQQTARLSNAGAWIRFEPREFSAVFGREFKPPEPTLFKFHSLAWVPAPAGEWRLTGIRKAPQVEWEPSPEMARAARRRGVTIVRRKRK